MKTEQTQYEKLQEVGRCAFESIAKMVASLECDYDRLAELRDERDSAESPEAWASENPDDSEELAELETAAGDCESREDAENRIQYDPLSVLFRSGWTAPGGDKMEPEEFEILLGTGGPATRIIGELDGRKQPCRAWLEAQDWGTPWTAYNGSDSETLLAYSRQFWFGE